MKKIILVICAAILFGSDISFAMKRAARRSSLKVLIKNRQAYKKSPVLAHKRKMSTAVHSNKPLHALPVAIAKRLTEKKMGTVFATEIILPVGDYASEQQEAYVKGKRLLQKRHDIFEKDHEGKTALHLAYLYNLHEYIQLLIAHHADILAVDNRGIKPVQYSKKAKIIEEELAYWDPEVIANNDLCTLQKIARNDEEKLVIPVVAYGSEFLIEEFMRLKMLKKDAGVPSLSLDISAFDVAGYIGNEEKVDFLDDLVEHLKKNEMQK